MVLVLLLRKVSEYFLHPWLLVSHTDLILCPREAASPVGKEGVPGVGGSLSCEKPKRRTVFEGFVFVFLFKQHRETQTQWKWKRKLISLCPTFNGRVWTLSARCNERDGKRRKWNERQTKKWELNKCIIQRGGRGKRGRDHLDLPPRCLLMWRWCLRCTVTSNKERQREARQFYLYSCFYFRLTQTQERAKGD